MIVKNRFRSIFLNSIFSKKVRIEKNNNNSPIYLFNKRFFRTNLSPQKQGVVLYTRCVLKHQSLP